MLNNTFFSLLHCTLKAETHSDFVPDSSGYWVGAWRESAANTHWIWTLGAEQQAGAVRDK